jgi:hypothetical protein
MSRRDSVKNRVTTGVWTPIEGRGRRAVRTELAPTQEMFHDPAVMRGTFDGEQWLRQILNAQHAKVKKSPGFQAFRPVDLQSLDR